jgi:hypothetical protein
VSPAADARIDVPAALSSRFLFLALLCGLVLAAVSPAAGAQRSAGKRAPDPIADLERWTDDLRRNGPDVGLEEVHRLERLVADVRMLQIADPERREPVLALLDLAGVRTNKERRTRRTNEVLSSSVGQQTERLRDYGREALDLILAADSSGALADWLALQVLSQPRTQSAERRLAALRTLVGLYRPTTMLAIFACALEDEREVRDAAMEALVGWPADDVHRFMLKQLDRTHEKPGWVSRRAIRLHFATAPLDPGSPGGREVFAYASQRLLATDWREAFRAIQLLGAVQDDPAVPSLIEARAVGGDRRERGEGSRRIESELLGELERRSGRRIGNHPERWATWWKAVSSGAASAAPSEDPQRRTKAAFFGLRPVTDRVVFVIDRSGSMTAAFGAEGNTRYGEAVEQMMSFLRELGPETRFRVVLFSNQPEVWKDRLQPATQSNLDAAERWLRYHPPRGGTFLKPAIEHVLRLDELGRVELDRLEEDSVVVLCDGATAQGPGWVAELLDRTNDDACLAYHCVQIGRSSDGTLEALADGSGGDFVEVGQ